MSYNTVLVMSDFSLPKEAAAAGTITPGMLIERISAGTVRAHAAAGQNAVPLFALEDDLQGNDIDDDYAALDNVLFRHFLPGDEVYTLLNDGETAVIGSFLESAGNGKLQVHTASSAGAVEYPKAIVATALEAVDMSGSSGADPDGRILVEIA